MKHSSHRTWLQIALAVCVAMVQSSVTAAGEGPRKVDFRHAPPEWQTAICLPDDPHKSLVDRSGELLYHFGQGGREFATRVRVEVVDAAVWESQELYSPRVPISPRTSRPAFPRMFHDMEQQSTTAMRSDDGAYSKRTS